MTAPIAGPRAPEPAVLQVQIVNDRGHASNGGVTNLERLDKCLERAVFATVAEVHPEHVEGNPVARHGVPVGRKSEAGLPVDEATDEPRRRHPVDAGSRPRAPTDIGRYACGADDVVRAREAEADAGAPAPRRCSSWSSSATTRSRPALPKKSTRSIAARRCRKPSIRRRAVGGRRRSTRAARIHVALEIADQLGIGVLSRAPEFFDQRIVRPRVDAIGREDRRLSPGGLDLGLQPFEVLARPRRVRQHVDRLLDDDGAELLEPAPGPDANVRRDSTAAGGRTPASVASSTEALRRLDARAGCRCRGFFHRCNQRFNYNAFSLRARR